MKTWSSGNVLDLYLGGVWFESRLGRRLDWLKFLVVSRSLFSKVMGYKVKVKVNFALEQAMKVQMGSRGIAIIFL